VGDLRLSALYTAVVALFACLLAAPVQGQNVFERLVMPGPLIEGHAKYEKDCGNCHEPFSKASQSELCLNCHKEIATDKQGRQGLHGRMPEIVNSECKHCHTEHKGREAEIAPLDRETFDHGFTDFTLKGAHQAQRCEGCHKPAKAYREAPPLCIDCHKTDEPHKGRLGEKCADCHSDDSWKTVKPFDHSKTPFTLTGAHQKVDCKTCHSGERYKGIGTACALCHQLQDVHGGRYGAKCDSCHRPEKWTVTSFDHAKQTKFTLRGKHQETKCDTCHKGDLYRDKLSMDCVSCHKKDDAHQGQLGAKCETCHNESGWRQKVDFNHDKTRFPLIGLHGLVLCEACHRTPSFKDAPLKCASCHEDSFHEKRFGDDCALCHKPMGWKLWQFDHNKQTDYPLTGAHERVKCHSCHQKNVNARSVQLSTECYSCHAKDDPHYGLLGKKCDTCHTTTTFHLLNPLRARPKP